MLRYSLGDVVVLKKAHPCGSYRWEILRTGMDFRLRCLGCGHLVLMPRARFEKSVRQVIPRADPGGSPGRPGG